MGKDATPNIATYGGNYAEVAIKTNPFFVPKKTNYAIQTRLAKKRKKNKSKKRK